MTTMECGFDVLDLHTALRWATQVEDLPNHDRMNSLRCDIWLPAAILGYGWVVWMEVVTVAEGPRQFSDVFALSPFGLAADNLSSDSDFSQRAHPLGAWHFHSEN